jgi:hypothetical protein
VEVRDHRDELIDYLNGLPDSPAKAKVQRLIGAADNLLAAAGTAENRAAAAGYIAAAFGRIAAAQKSGSKIPSFVVAVINGAPFATSPGQIMAAYSIGSMSLDGFMLLDPEGITYTSLGFYIGAASIGSHELGRQGETSAYAFYRPNQGPSCAFSCPYYESTSGSVTITRIDETARIIEGVFAFEAEKLGGGAGPSTASVVAGRFRVKYSNR